MNLEWPLFISKLLFTSLYLLPLVVNCYQVVKILQAHFNIDFCILLNMGLVACRASLVVGPCWIGDQIPFKSPFPMIFVFVY